MNKDLFDSHSHLDAPEFEHDRSAVVARAQAEGVKQQLLPAVEFAIFLHDFFVFKFLTAAD